MLEEQVGGVTQARNLWSPVYVNALILRDQSSAGDGTLDQRLYVLQDANWNVTALVDASGDVIERYVYSPFGVLTILAPDWTMRESSSYGFKYLFQGGRYDLATGNYQFGIRGFRPTTGQWLQRDPLGFAAGDLNIGRFVGDNPANATDPSGLSARGWGFARMGLGFLGFVGSAYMIECPPACYAAAAISAGEVTAGGYQIWNNEYVGDPIEEAVSTTAQMAGMDRLNAKRLGTGVSFSVQAVAAAGSLYYFYRCLRPTALNAGPVPTAIDVYAGAGSPSGFGKLIGWGGSTGNAAANAAARTTSITLQEIQAAGITVPVAQYWLNFYNTAIANEAGGATAVERAKLMQRVLQLLGE